MADLAQLHPVFRARLLALAADVGGLSWTSGWRSSKRQGELYDCWKARRPGCAPANRPGTSNHEAIPYGAPQALAMDIGRLNRSAAHGRARAHGLHFPIAGEPWHIECIETSGRFTGVPNFPDQEDEMNGDQEALLRQVFDEAKGAHQTANRLEGRVAVLEAALIDASGVTVVQWSRRTVRLARIAAMEGVRAMYARTGRPLATGDETAIERSWRHVDEIETRKRPGGGARDGMELELTLEAQARKDDRSGG